MAHTAPALLLSPFTLIYSHKPVIYSHKPVQRCSKNECVRINFQGPFRFDIEVGPRELAGQLQSFHRNSSV